MTDAFAASHTQEIVCPHCGYVHGDSWEMPDSDNDFECSECEKLFSYERYIEITYTTRKPKEVPNG
jgi:DNA-directed RNA polymerase subunit RPC12/RpoP